MLVIVIVILVVVIVRVRVRVRVRADGLSRPAPCPPQNILARSLLFQRWDANARYRCLWNWHCSGEDNTWKCKVTEHQIRGQDRSFCCGAAGRVLAQKECFFRHRYVLARSVARGPIILFTDLYYITCVYVYIYIYIHADAHA